MLRFFLGKDAKKQIIEAMVEKAPNILAEKISGSILAKPSDNEKLEIEKRKLFIEESKLQLEQKKLELEYEKKIQNNLEVAEINARSRQNAAYVRSLTTLLAAFMAATATYLYFRPLEDELKKCKSNLREKEKELQDVKGKEKRLQGEYQELKLAYYSAELALDMEKEITAEMQKSLPKELVQTISDRRGVLEQNRITEVSNYRATLYKKKILADDSENTQNFNDTLPKKV